MSDLPPAMRGAFERVLPTASGDHAMTTLSISGSAASLNLNGSWGSLTNRLANNGPRWITVEAVTADAYVVASATATTAATSSTGTKVDAGKSKDFWVLPGRSFLDVLGSTSGTLKVYFSDHPELT